ncbi:MAG TPA: hypothetical protein VGW57_08595 [Chthoniobacterales bacterium]|nr:hypothetical protein [Chthoniobacterales bacterium]
MQQPIFVFRPAFKALIVAVAVAAAAIPARATVVDLNAPTTAWTPIQYSNNNPDPSNDQQTGSPEGDIVGNAAHPSVYTMFGDGGTPSLTDGTLGFRIRLGADTNPSGFKTALFVGIDANSDGKLDLFLGVNNSGSADTVGIWNPGTGANVSPSTTSMVANPLSSYAPTASNYSWSLVTTTIDPSVGTATDLDGGGQTDYFLGFAIPFTDVVAQLAAAGITFDQNSTLTYVIATATQANSLNQDLNGVAGSVNSSLTWSQLGVLSNPMTAGGLAAVPEINPALCVGLFLVAVGLQRRLSRRTTPKRQAVPVVRS